MTRGLTVPAILALLLEGWPALLGIGPGNPPAAGAEVRDFYNVIAPAGADPWVVRHDGQYYLTLTTNDDITIRRSATLSGLGAGEAKVVWTPPASGPNSKNLWAPELHRLDGKWYVYYAADDGDNANHRMFVLENPAADPFQGRFVDKGKVFDRRNDRWAIDGTVFTLAGKRYFLWSGWEGGENVRQNLYVAPMSNPWTLAGPRVEISRPTHRWETVGTPAVNEGPQVLIRGDTVNLVYSASGSWTDHYCLGLLTAKAGSDPLRPSSWTKRAEPVFQSGNGVIAPGHCGFARSPDGAEDWLLYHAARYNGAGWARNIRTQKFGWNSDGTPRFGRPAPPNAPIPLPGGDPGRLRREAEGARLAGAAEVVRDATASGKAKVRIPATPESHAEFQVDVDRAGAHYLSVRFAHAAGRRARAGHELSVNGRPAPPLTYVHSGRGNWSNVTVRVELASGLNRVRLGKGRHPVEVDCLDVFPDPRGRRP
jgi:GH43 family beta-xylosidase